jgi:hypothetical protein
LIELTELLQHQLKHQGLSRQALLRFDQALAQRSLCSRAQRVAEQARAYLQRETQGLVDDEVLLATSDVLESLFGKYKHFSSRGPLREASKLLLILPLCTIELTSQWVKNALETVSTADVKHWAKATFGLSGLARRHDALGVRKRTQNQHDKIALETS